MCVPVCVCMQRFYKKAAAFVLRAVAKHSPELSQAVVACGGVDALVLCLEDFDPGVKEAAAWALGYIARHNTCNEVTLTHLDFYDFLLYFFSSSCDSLPWDSTPSPYFTCMCLFFPPLFITVQCCLSRSWMRVLFPCW